MIFATLALTRGPIMSARDKICRKHGMKKEAPPPHCFRSPNIPQGEERSEILRWRISN